ncbi:hypothetical protein, partial [Helicobacter japonicus]
MSRTKKHNNKKLNIGFVLLGIQVFASLLFIFFLLRLSLIPTPILLLVGVILLLTVLFVLLSLMKKKRGKKMVKKMTNKDEKFYQYMGKFFGSRLIEKQTNDRIYDDDSKEWYICAEEGRVMAFVVAIDGPSGTG